MHITRRGFYAVISSTDIYGSSLNELPLILYCSLGNIHYGAFIENVKQVSEEIELSDRAAHL
jgi:hypothetical protein